MTSITELLNKKKQENTDKRMGSKKPYKFKNGVTTIRILPGWRKNDPTFFHSFGQSFIKDMDGNVLAVIGARNIAYGEDDPIQNLIQTAKAQAKTDSQRRHWHESIARHRELVNALILDDKDVDPNTPEIVDFSANMLEQIIDQVQMAGIQEEFLDLEKGFNLKVSRSGSGLNTKYSFVFERKPTPIGSSVMENINDLDAYVRSQMQDTDRAINAIKSLTAAGEHLQIEDRSRSYSGDVEDAEFDAVESATNTDEVPWDVENRKEIISDEDINSLFGDD